MVWTAPKTWTSVVLPVSDLNTHVRDNFNETAPAKAVAAGDLFRATGANAIARIAVGTAGQHLRVVSGLPAWSSVRDALAVRKTANESASGGTLQNDDVLVLAVDANTNYYVELMLLANLSVNEGIKFGWSLPSGATFNMSFVSWDDAPTLRAVTRGATTSPWYSRAPGAGENALIHAVGFLAIGGTGGNAQLQWALAGDLGGSTQVNAGSVMLLVRM